MKASHQVGAGPGYTPNDVTVHRRPEELAKVTRALRSTGRTITLVPTMGALHEGHMELIRAARAVPGNITVVSIFVNPLQFGEGEDYERYPRTFESDVEACREAGVELVFAPDTEAMYGSDPQLSVHPGPLGEELEGAARPGHFAGVLTAVLKLLNIVRPDQAFFGEKDYQQLVLINRMAREFNLDVQVLGVPVVRESDGLALSSRNAYLDAEHRSAAAVLSAALAAGSHAGSGGAAAVLSAVREVLAEEPRLEVEYVELRSRDLGPAPEEGEARLLAAVRAGGTRLIDNVGATLGGGME
ncbi:pantoate--beta-alanine ligase [Salinifilum aidingensis]